MATPLKRGVDPLDGNGQHLSVVIYWHPRKGPDAVQNGHAALIIDADEWLNAPITDQLSSFPPCYHNTEWYVSWLGGKIDWKPGVGSWGGNKGVFSKFLDDMCVWGGEQVAATAPYADLRWPIRWVALQGLRVNDMRDAWDAARTKTGAHWNLLRKNCATMVHTVLKAGGGDQFATAHKKQLVWWPSDLIRYAKSMTGHVYKSSSTPAAQFQ